jgi:hypothetical protein
MEHWGRNPDRFGHLLRVAYLAGRCILPQGMVVAPSPLGLLGDMDAWAWECLLIIADAWNASDDKTTSED